jgi:hypothetical protein
MDVALKVTNQPQECSSVDNIDPVAVKVLERKRQFRIESA